MSIALRLPPVLVTLLAGLGMWMTARLAPGLVGAEAFVGWRAAVAAALAMAGVAVAAAGVREFRKAHTTLNPMTPGTSTTLVTSGIYSRLRNPMYLGMLLVLLGWSAWLWNPWVLAWPLVFVVYMNQFQIKPEEAALRKRFGDPMADYMQRTKRWL